MSINEFVGEIGNLLTSTNSGKVIGISSTGQPVAVTGGTGGVTSSGTSTRQEWSITSDAGTPEIFTFPHVMGYLDVYKNGIKLENSGFTDISSTQFSVNTTSGDYIFAECSIIGTIGGSGGGTGLGSSSQSWHNFIISGTSQNRFVSSSGSHIYHNSSSDPMAIMVSGQQTGGTENQAGIKINGVVAVQDGGSTYDGSNKVALYAIIPPSATYEVILTQGSLTLLTWAELY